MGKPKGCTKSLHVCLFSFVDQLAQVCCHLQISNEDIKHFGDQSMSIDQIRQQTCWRMIDAIRFIARYGHHFLAEYDFDIYTGTWEHRRAAHNLPEFSLDEALGNDEGEPAILSLPLRKQLYDHYMTEAKRWVERLRAEPEAATETLEGDLEELQFFTLPAGQRGPGQPLD